MLKSSTLVGSLQKILVINDMVKFGNKKEYCPQCIRAASFTHPVHLPLHFHTLLQYTFKPTQHHFQILDHKHIQNGTMQDEEGRKDQANLVKSQAQHKKPSHKHSTAKISFTKHTHQARRRRKNSLHNPPLPQNAPQLRPPPLHVTSPKLNSARRIQRIHCVGHYTIGRERKRNCTRGSGHHQSSRR